MQISIINNCSGLENPLYEEIQYETTTIYERPTNHL